MKVTGASNPQIAAARSGTRRSLSDPRGGFAHVGRFWARTEDDVAENVDRVKDGLSDVADKVSDTVEDVIPGDNAAARSIEDGSASAPTGARRCLTPGLPSRQLFPREPRQVLRAAHEVQDENDQQNNHKNPNYSIARSGDGKRHVSSFVVCRLSVSISSSS